MNLTSGQRDALGRAVLDWVLRYFDRASEPPIYPTVSAAELEAMVEEPLPEHAQDLAAVVEQFGKLAAMGRNNGHPRMFGYVQSSGSFAGVAADFLASALNQNVTSWRSAPSATAVEHQTIEWIKQLVGFHPGGSGLLLSGGSLANLAAIAVALRASTDLDLNERGVGALDGHARIYASTLVHMSIPKAAALLGVGRQSMVLIPVDDDFRMDAAALALQIASDRAAGLHPVCVVANAGDVNTGAIDPLVAIADVCAAEQVWLHVDGSYGGFAASAPSVGAAMKGLDRADSISLDPHKWLFAPLDAGCLLVRNPAHLRRAFAHGAAYIDVVADRDMSEFAFWDHGPELSRRFRALKIWFILKCHGARALRAAIDDNIRVARELADAIDASDDFERLAPVPLSIVCFRYLPEAYRLTTSAKASVVKKPEATVADDEALNAFNRALMVEVQRDGEAYPSNAMIGSRFALRACIVNYRTTSEDVEKLLGAIRRVAGRMT